MRNDRRHQKDRVSGDPESNSATKVVASAFGVLAGLLGMEQGYFEMLQGDVTPGSLLINAIGPPCQPDTAWHGCEPAMTIIPSFLMTGILAIIVSLMVLVWAAVFVRRKRSGRVLILLSVIQLLLVEGLHLPSSASSQALPPPK